MSRNRKKAVYALSFVIALTIVCLCASKNQNIGYIAVPVIGFFYAAAKHFDNQFAANEDDGFAEPFLSEKSVA